MPTALNRRRHATSLAGLTLLLLMGLVASVATHEPVQAQESAPVEEIEPGELIPGDRVRVTTAEGAEIRGRVLRVTERSMTLVGRDDEERVVARDEAADIQVERSRVASFAKGGAVVGGLGMAATSAYVLNALCSGSTDCGGEVGLAVVAGGALGALGGALVGALIGAAATDWEQAALPGRSSESQALRLHLGLEEALAGDAPSVGLSLALPAPR